MVVTIVLVTPQSRHIEQAHSVVAVHGPNEYGFCQGCLDGARLAWSPCPQRMWATKVLAAEEATR